MLRCARQDATSCTADPAVRHASCAPHGVTRHAFCHPSSLRLVVRGVSSPLTLDVLVPSLGSGSSWGHVAVSGDIFGCYSWSAELPASCVEATDATNLNRTEWPPAESGLASPQRGAREPLPLVACRLCQMF